MVPSLRWGSSPRSIMACARAASANRMTGARLTASGRAEDLLCLGADGADVGFEDEVVGDGRRPVLGLQVGGEGGDLVAERDLGLPAG